MKNRFLEWDFRNLPTASKSHSSNGISVAKSLNGTRAFAGPTRRRATSFSVKQTVLVILIENGGIDLGIPDIVDKILDKVPGSSFLPGSVRAQMIKLIREKIIALTDSLAEDFELSLNRYTSAAPDIFNSVVVLRNSSATYTDLKNTLTKFSKDDIIIDLMILTHGSDDSISVTGGVNSQKIREMKNDFGAPLKIRSVYMMNCVGQSLNQAWLDAGAKTSCGTAKNNYLPEPTTFFFFRNWKGGDSFETAATSAYKQTIAAMNAIVQSLASVIPGGSLLAGAINFADFEFVQDSAPQVAGEGSVTINSKDLSFTQSVQFSAFTTTVVPTRRLGSYRRARAMEAEMATMSASANCIAMIKKFEGFKQQRYTDGGGNCAVGYGTVLHAGACNERDTVEQPYINGITEEKATELLVAAITAAQKTVRDLVKTPLNQNQFDALVSFVHNVTPDAFVKSTLLRILNEGNTTGAADEMKKWINGMQGDKIVALPELIERRKTETDLFAAAVPVAPVAPAIAASLSYYSRPFYDTGEHSIAGQYIDKITNSPAANMDELSPTHLYSVNGVSFTYGQIITMGDFFESYTEMSKAGAAELEGLKKLIVRSENVYKNAIYKMGVGNAQDPSQSDWQTTTGGRYLTLAEVNNSHFAPAPAGTAFGGAKKADHKSTWERYHKMAVDTVKRGSNSDDYEEALKINAFGDHFLTDAFAAGHLINKQFLIEQFKKLTLAGGKVNKDGESLLRDIATQSFKGAVAKEFSKYQTVKTAYWVNGFLDDASMFARLLIGVYEQEPDKIANLFVKAIHDALNHYPGGVTATNGKGQTWQLTGDGTMNDDNRQHIQEAVAQSVINIRDAVSGKDTFPTLVAKVWAFVPVAGNASTKAILDGVLKDYSSFGNGKLTAKAVDLITDEHLELIQKLKEKKAIEPRESGPLHPLNTIGNFINDHT